MFFIIHYIFDNNIFFYIIYELNSELIFYSFCSIFVALFFNIIRLKIIELKTPSYNIIPNLLRVIVIDIFINKREFTIDFILYNIFSLLGAFIFCEVITLHFYGLAKDTINETMERSDLDSSILFSTNISLVSNK